MADNEPHAVDISVGARVRTRRKIVRMSQQALAQALDLTFQQVQKYESGANRISASKLFQIADVLRVPIGYFFESLGDAEDMTPAAAGDIRMQGFLLTAEGVEMARTFPKISSAKQRRHLLDLIKSLADDGDTASA